MVTDFEPVTSIDEYFFAQQVAPEQMDYLWAQGWRHFGVYFFRYSIAVRADGSHNVIPLRIKLANFKLSSSQKRIIKKNQDLQVEIRDAFIDEEKEALFERHRIRFTENVPQSIYDFLSPVPAIVPCPTREICLFRDGQLIAVSFLDLGDHSSSSVYAIYEPTETKRSLGIYLILQSMAYSMECGKRYYYHGYAYRQPSHYDYKKRFSGLEQYDWQSWNPIPKK